MEKGKIWVEERWKNVIAILVLVPYVSLMVLANPISIFIIKAGEETKGRWVGRLLRNWRFLS